MQLMKLDVRMTLYLGAAFGVVLLHPRFETDPRFGRCLAQEQPLEKFRHLLVGEGFERARLSRRLEDDLAFVIVVLLSGGTFSRRCSSGCDRCHKGFGIHRCLPWHWRRGSGRLHLRVLGS